MVFDFDGTLVDTAPVICHAFAEAVSDTPAARSEGAFRELLGQPLSHVHAHLCRTIPDYRQRFDEFVDRYRIAHDAIADEGYALFVGVRGMLEDLDVPLAIASTKPSAIVRHHARALGIEGLFAHIQGTDGFAFKPSPEILDHVWRHAPASPSRTVFVGDSVSDIQAGCAAMACPVGVSYGAHSASSLLAAGAVAVLASAPELHTYLLS